MTRGIRNVLVVMAALGLPLLPSVTAAEIPSGLEQRGRAPGSAGAAAIPDQAEALDHVELAELAKSDPSQKGGGPVTTVILIAAIVILLILL